MTHEYTPEGERIDATPTLTADIELTPGYFVQIRTDFLRRGDRSPEYKMAYMLLLSYAAAGDQAFPGQDLLAEQAGCSVKAIRAAITQLADDGLVIVTRRGQGLPNTYHLRKLPTLPPKSKPNSDLPESSIPERQKRPIKTGENDPSRQDENAGELYSEKTDLEKRKRGERARENGVSERTIPPPPSGSSKPSVSDLDKPLLGRGAHLFKLKFESTQGRPPVMPPAHLLAQIERIFAEVGEARFTKAMGGFFGCLGGVDKFPQKCGFTMAIFLKQFDTWEGGNAHGTGDATGNGTPGRSKYKPGAYED